MRALVVIAVVVAALVSGAVVERAIIRPRREAAASIAEARALAEKNGESDWSAAEQLLSRAGALYPKEVADVRATIRGKRERASSELVMRLESCLTNVEKQWPERKGEMDAIRAERASAKPIDLLLRCTTVQIDILKKLALPSAKSP